ncbi:MAG: hypothetical protein JO114_01285 [Planctomycetaceae bacterium]|nr:hypothetical protein [Planctomycetaceae bacterium]MBV8311086.1 hypothetical protein [Planctomycetaceae bacterium]
MNLPRNVLSPVRVHPVACYRAGGDVPAGRLMLSGEQYQVNLGAGSPGCFHT